LRLAGQGESRVGVHRLRGRQTWQCREASRVPGRAVERALHPLAGGRPAQGQFLPYIPWAHTGSNGSGTHAQGRELTGRDDGSHSGVGGFRLGVCGFGTARAHHRAASDCKGLPVPRVKSYLLSARGCSQPCCCQRGREAPSLAASTGCSPWPRLRRFGSDGELRRPMARHGDDGTIQSGHHADSDPRGLWWDRAEPDLPVSRLAAGGVVCCADRRGVQRAWPRLPERAGVPRSCRVPLVPIRSAGSAGDNPLEWGKRPFFTDR
jgi:hypothetical protein